MRDSADRLKKEKNAISLEDCHVSSNITRLPMNDNNETGSLTSRITGLSSRRQRCLEMSMFERETNLLRSYYEEFLNLA